MDPLRALLLARPPLSDDQRDADPDLLYSVEEEDR